jgi:hypothetical protein
MKKLGTKSLPLLRSNSGRDDGVVEETQLQTIKTTRENATWHIQHKRAMLNTSEHHPFKAIVLRKMAGATTCCSSSAQFLAIRRLYQEGDILLQSESIPFGHPQLSLLEDNYGSPSRGVPSKAFQRHRLQHAVQPLVFDNFKRLAITGGYKF